MFILSLLTITLVALLFLPVRFFIVFDNCNLKAKCKFLFFCFDFNGQQNKRKSISKKKRKKNSKDREKNSKILTKSIKYYKSIVVIFALFVKNIFRSMSKFRLNITIGAQDSSAVALRYGKFCSAVMFLAKYVFDDKIKNKSISIKPDFSGNTVHEIVADCSFSINLVNIIKCLIKLALDFLRREIFTSERKTA